MDRAPVSRPEMPADTALERVRSGLRGLTTRGRSFIAAGVAAGACAFLLGQRDLLRVGVLLIALPLICVIVVSRGQLRVRLERGITPKRVVAGSPARIRLELTNLGRSSTAVFMAEDAVPYRLGVSPRFVVSRLPGGRRAAVSYTLQTDQRGQYRIGPLSLVASDPFGMCEVSRSFTAGDSLIVLPRTWPLAGSPSGGHWIGDGEATRGRVAASGDHDVAIREYRRGDDLRRVHWRSTARRGEIMVRQDEQPRQMRATVLLDTRHQAHRGEGSTSSFEWAVTAAASMGAHLAKQRYAVRLLTPDDLTAEWTARHDGAGGADDVLDRLALVEPGVAESLAATAAALRRGNGDGVVAAVLGDLTQTDVSTLAAGLPQRATGLAVLMDTDTWTPQTGRAGGRTRSDAVKTLRRAGWVVLEAGSGQTIQQVWLRALGGGTPSTDQQGAPAAYASAAAVRPHHANGAVR